MGKRIGRGMGREGWGEGRSIVRDVSEGNEREKEGRQVKGGR